MSNEEKILAMLEQMQAEMRDGFEKVHGEIGDIRRSTEKHMKITSEGLAHLNDRYAQLDKVEQTVDDHSNRIYALEQKAANE